MNVPSCLKDHSRQCPLKDVGDSYRSRLHTAFTFSFSSFFKLYMFRRMYCSRDVTLDVRCYERDKGGKVVKEESKDTGRKMLRLELPGRFMDVVREGRNLWVGLDGDS